MIIQTKVGRREGVIKWARGIRLVSVQPPPPITCSSSNDRCLYCHCVYTERPNLIGNIKTKIGADLLLQWGIASPYIQSMHL